MKHAPARERKAAAERLAQAIVERPSHPLARLATVSPRVAERLNLPVLSPPSRPPKLKTIARRKEGDYA
jgi:hypothetical protein